MKKLLVLIFPLLLSVSVFAQAGKMSSVYTSLSDKVCKKLKNPDNEGEDYSGLCPGIGGYKINLIEGDLRQTIDVIAPNKKSYQLDLWSVVSSQFSYLGQKAEWRVSGAGKTARPAALIVRFSAYNGGEDSQKATSYLVVIKIAKDSACVTDIVSPSAAANEEARKLADASANKPCKTE